MKSILYNHINSFDCCVDNSSNNKRYNHGCDSYEDAQIILWRI